MGNVQQLGKLLTVGSCLVQHDNELGVGQHGAGLYGVQKIFHILRNGCGICVALTELTPCGIEELCRELIFKDNMELVDEDMSTLALLPVDGDAVQHGICNHKQTGRLQLCTKAVNIKYHHALVQIHIAAMTEDVQRTGGIQFQGQSNLLCFGFGLLKQLLAQSVQRRNNAGFLCFTIDRSSTTVDDGLLLGTNALAVDLLHQGHDELRFDNDRIVLTVAVNHIHGIQSVTTACGNPDNGRDLLHGFEHGGIFTFGVADQNVIIGIQQQEENQFLCGEGLTGTGNTQNEGGLVHQIFSIAHDEVMGDRVLAKVDTALVHDLLHLEGNEYGKRFGGQSAERIDLADTERQHGLETVHLLILQGCHLAHVLTGDGKNGIGIAVKLFLGISGVYHGHNGEHHALVTGGKVIQELLGFLALQFHVIRNHRREIVVAILAALPVGDIGFDAQQTAFNLSHCFIRRNGIDIDGEHQTAVQIGQLRYHGILDIGGIVLEKNDTGELAADLQIVAVLLQRVRADIVTEIMSEFHAGAQAQAVGTLITGTEEIVEHTQTVICVQFSTLGAKSRKVCGQICAYTGKVATGFLDILFRNRNGNQLDLHNAVGTHGFVYEHLVVFLTIDIQFIPTHGHQNGFLKVGLINRLVVHGDLCGCSAVQAVQEFGVN